MPITLEVLEISSSFTFVLLSPVKWINTKIKIILGKYVNLYPIICNVFSIVKKLEVIFLLRKLTMLTKDLCYYYSNIQTSIQMIGAVCLMLWHFYIINKISFKKINICSLRIESSLLNKLLLK